MLKTDVAKKQLEKWSIEDGKEKLVATIKKQPAKFREIAFGLLDRDSEGQSFGYERWEERSEAIDEQKEGLEGLNKGDRAKLFKLLLGPLADGALLTYEHLKQVPYQFGVERRAFRAPRKPAASADLRFYWLKHLLGLTTQYQPDVQTPEWLAAWAPYLTYGDQGNEWGRLLSAVIDGGGKQGQAVFDVLYQSATNEHEIGGMGRHVTRGLLGAAREDGWQLMEKLLLAAQRQEGLRQALLETIDEAHPQAFRRMLRIIVDENLARFSAVARAVDVWFGMQWDSASVKTINNSCETALTVLESEKARRNALQSNSAEQVFIGLWATAFDDVEPSLAAAEKLATHREPAHRFVAAYHLQQTLLPDVQPALVKMLDDQDLQVALQAMSGMEGAVNGTSVDAKKQAARFAALERLFQRLPPKPVKLEAIVWPWTAKETDRGEVAVHLVNSIGSLPPSRLIRYLQEFDPRNRARACDHLASRKKWDNETRESLVTLIGDSSQDVRRFALAAFATKPLTPVEAERLEGFLTRTASDLRQGAVRLLLAQQDQAAIASTERLTASSNASQRLAGLELLKELAEAERQRTKCLELARGFQSKQKRLSKEEETHLNTILATGDEKITLENGLGLFNPAERSPRFVPKKQKTAAFTPAAPKLLKSLDDLIHEHRADPIQIKNWRNEVREEPLGGIRYGFPTPDWNRPVREQLNAFPLCETWLKWEKDRSDALRDADRGELLRARCLLELVEDYRWDDTDLYLKKAPRKDLRRYLIGSAAFPKLKYPQLIGDVLLWFVRLQAGPTAIDIAQDVCESTFALIPADDHQPLIELRKTQPSRSRYHDSSSEPNDWRLVDMYEHWLTAPQGVLRSGKANEVLPPPVRARQWQLQRWLDEPTNDAARKRPEISQVQSAFECGAATFADIMDQLIGPDNGEFSALSTFTSPRPQPETAAFLKSFPEVRQGLDRIRERVLEIELARGDLPTPATAPVAAINSFFGTATLVRVLSALGKERFKQQRYSWRNTGGRAEGFTGIIKACYPAASDTSEEFNRLVKEAVRAGAFGEEKILQLAFLAPQWTQLVKDYFGWEALDEGLYWFLAHMRFVSGGEEAALAAGVEEEADEPANATESSTGEEAQPRAPRLSAWERLVLERTPLSGEDRFKGVVDVAWFHRTFEQLGRKKWEAIAEASRFAATSAQSKRAQFIADVLLGNVKKSELVTAIRDRKLKDNVRLLGLLPLAPGAKREADLQDRYQILQEYKKYAKGLSSLSRPDAELAAEIGLQNLAQLAGYEDPLRLEWAMEAEATQDLLKGPIVVSKGDVTMTLTLDDRAQPQVSVERAGKPLKTLPKSHKDEKQFTNLSDRSRELKRQASRVRGSLEAAMLRGDVFTGVELGQVARHALLKPMLERLVLIGEGIMGYPDKQGKVLRSHDGTLEPVKKNENFRIAHTFDLYAAKEWDHWQRECFRAERLQPFKQVFRELYVVTSQEKADKTKSRRYAGQQVNPQQAYALWGQRGWNVDEGVFKVFHGQGITVAVQFNYGITTPLEVEGLTIETVQFVDREHNVVELSKVPTRIFSEVMRDLDLVVSIAHRGGVDPEASASTVEMRSSLLQETCDLLGIKNVKLNKSHAVIKGFLSDYTVHLGSAVVHRLPGGSVCLVPVHSQHRGRLFLPFADDDPKTAEVISKTLLLAKDNEILDPIILEQIRA